MWIVNASTYMNEHWAWQFNELYKNKYKIHISFNYNCTKTTYATYVYCWILSQTIIFEWILLPSPMCVWNGFVFLVYAFSLNSIMSQINRIELFPWHFFHSHFMLENVLHLHTFALDSRIENLFNLLCFWLFSVFSESAFQHTSYSRAMI